MLTWDEVISRIKQRYPGAVEVDTEGEEPLLIVDGEVIFSIPYEMPHDEVPAPFLKYLCDKLTQLHPTELGLDWPAPDA